jgi:Molecular chaperone (small heat shock protein)
MLLQRLTDNSILDSFKEMERFQRQLNRLFYNGMEGRVGEFPPVNVCATNDGCIVTAEIPGVEAGNIDISVVNETLTITGERHSEKLEESDTYHRKERLFGKFARSVELPFQIEADKVDATFSNGVLTIKLPRAEAEKPRKISISSN